MSVPILSDIFGDKPDVIGMRKIDLGQQQIQSIINNLKALSGGDVQKLGNLFQQYMLSQYAGAGLDLRGLISKGAGVTSTLLDQAGQEAKGLVPQDVMDAVRRGTAFQNLGSGIMGGPMGAANWARNLGLTSLDMINKGANLLGSAGNAAQRWAQIAGGTMLPINNFLINPMQQYESTLQNALIQRQIKQERANVAAAPNPIAKGLSDLVAYLTASYIGHGPAGQPPKAEEFSAETAGPENAISGDALFGNQGSAIDQMFPDTGINTWGGAGAGYAGPSDLNDTFALPSGGAGTADTGGTGFLWDQGTGLNTGTPLTGQNTSPPNFLYGENYYTPPQQTFNNQNLFWGA